MTSLKDKIETVSLDEVEPSPDNPKEHPEQLIADLKESLDEFGQAWPICVDEDYEIVDGHARYKAMQELGWEEIEVIRHDDWTEDMIERARTIFGKTQQRAEFDEEGVARILEKYEGTDKFTGFTEEETAQVLADFDTDKEVEEDDYTPPEAEAVETDIEKGDIFKLGDHLLLCGDATEKKEVQILFDTVPSVSEAHMMLTDPPY
ncbi:MAG: ParB N-terminal domain-containing protein, partial [Candidatus Nanohaloarchaea archaeon]